MDNNHSPDDGLIAAHGFTLQGRVLTADPCVTGGVQIAFAVNPADLAGSICSYTSAFPERRIVRRLALRMGLRRARQAAQNIRDELWSLGVELALAEEDAESSRCAS